MNAPYIITSPSATSYPTEIDRENLSATLPLDETNNLAYLLQILSLNSNPIFEVENDSGSGEEDNDLLNDGFRQAPIAHDYRQTQNKRKVDCYLPQDNIENPRALKKHRVLKENWDPRPNKRLLLEENDINLRPSKIFRKS